MHWGAEGIEIWIWIAGITLTICMLALLRFAHNIWKRDLFRFAHFQTIFRLFTEDIWKTPEDFKQASSGDPQHLSGMIRTAISRRRLVKQSLLMLSMIFITAALGRPQWGVKQEPVFRQGIDLVLAVDSSESMKAEDIAPSRLKKAQSLIAGLLSRLEGNRAALIGFASTTRLHCPLTLDFRGLRSILDNSISFGRGTNIEIAITKSLALLQNSMTKTKVILILTDGEGHDGDIDHSINACKAANVKVFAIGIGTPEGGPIPEEMDGDPSGYKKRNGEIIFTRLDEDTLKKIASETGGAYFRATAAELEVHAIAGMIEKLEKTEFSQTMTTSREDRFGIFLFIAIVLIAVEAALGDFRKIGYRAQDDA